MTIHTLAADIVTTLHNAPQESRLNLEDLVARKVKAFMAEQIFKPQAAVEAEYEVLIKDYEQRGS